MSERTADAVIDELRARVREAEAQTMAREWVLIGIAIDRFTTSNAMDEWDAEMEHARAKQNAAYEEQGRRDQEALRYDHDE